MALPSSLTLQGLCGLDTSSSDFHDQLCSVFYAEEYKQCLTNLDGDDDIWLADYLDEVLNVLEPSSAASRKCQRELKKLCGTRSILPSSYALPSQALHVNPEPFASGGFGEVFKGTLDGSMVCIKRMRVYAQDAPGKATKAFCHEAVMWKRLIHPNVVPLLGVTTSPRLLLISEWLPGGDLPEYIKKNPEANRLALLCDVAKGLQYLHYSNVVHGDLKGKNILVDRSGHAQIADFGLAMVTKNLDSVSSSSENRGNSPRWSAPEVLNDGVYSKEADVFSLGMVMYEALTGAVPFKEKSSTAAILDIIANVRPPQPTQPVFTSKLWALMERCWAQDPRLRPEASGVLENLLTLDIPAWKQLTTQDLPRDDHIFLITMVFSDPTQIKVIGNLSRDDVQPFIDKVDEVLDSLAPQIQEKYLRYLSSVCSRQTLLPRSLEIPFCHDQMKELVSRGELAEVWKGQYQGRNVRAQVLRIWPGDDTEQIKRRFFGEVVKWRSFHHPNVLPLLGVTITGTRFAVLSDWTARGNVRIFMKAVPNVDSLGLLRDVTRGLTYLHEQTTVHGDLSGANVLIDNNGRARLSGFGLATIGSTLPHAQASDGTTPWKSPELLFPLSFGLAEGRPTKESDYYALGMVMYEILSGQLPFAECWSPQIAFLVLEGKRPARPQGISDRMWEVLELCWKQQPVERISAEGVLARLDGNPAWWRHPTASGSEGLPAPRQTSHTNERFVGVLVGGVKQLFGH